MRVLVTGGAGYIGSVIVEELIGAGHSAIVYDSLAKGHRDALHPAATLVVGDTRDETRLRQALTEHRVEAVIHMAGFIQVGESVQDPAGYFDNNVAGGIHLLQAMVATGVKRLVFSSTAALYGDPEHLPIAETEPTKPTNPYGESKLAFERMLPWVAQAHGMACISLRYFNAAGATERNGEMHEPESHLIPLVLNAAQAGSPMSIYGTDYPTIDGTGVRDYIHVVDLAQAHILVLLRCPPGMHIYNVGNGNGYSVRQVIDAARQVTGRPITVHELPRRPGDQAATVASSAKIRRDLGWEPRYPEIERIVESAWRWKLAHPHGYER